MKSAREAKRATPLMFLGTASFVGKTVIAAAFCRIFKQDGHKVAPFKAQNMALNSFVTPEGKEMGRAQVVQAEAAGLIPHVDMNPVLLKPTKGAGSQVILNGRVLGNFGERGFNEIRSKLLAQIEESYARLAGEYEIIVLEGAGSCAEVNLRDRDIVNFSMAQRAGARVILVADIDRGGVFAQIIGHMELISEAERDLVAGFIINKFRGDVSLLGDGLEFIEQRTKKPVFGVVPFFRDIAIMEEDSVALGEEDEQKEDGEGRLRVGVVSLPHISNTTDFKILDHDPRVSLSYMSRPSRVRECHVAILPGTKNTLADLEFLRETGLYEALLDFSLAGGAVVGICGGFQMLGRTLTDPDGVEGPAARAEGLGLLPMDTTFAKEKVTTQVVAHPIGFRWAKGCAPVQGYEIHMGYSRPFEEARPAFVITRASEKDVELADGLMADGGATWGTYIHGIFDNDDFRERWIQGLARELDLDLGPGPDLSFKSWREAQYDRLADLVRGSVDVAAIYRELGLSPSG